MPTRELDRALGEIRAIRRQVAESTEFRGYGPVSLAATSLVAVGAGLLQWRWLPQAASQPWFYVMLWLSVAVLCAALIATEMLARARRLHAGIADEMVQMAVTQFLPAGLTGAVLPFVLLRAPTAVFWMLPGLWQIVFSLGVFASCRSLPPKMRWVGVWFLFTGFLSLLAGESVALSPAVMSGAFALGMAMVASIHAASAREKGVRHGQEH